MASTEPPEAVAADNQGDKSKDSIFVGDLDKHVDESDLYELFSKIGPVASVRVCRDSVTRRSRGFAYVNYNTSLDPKAPEKAIELLAYTPIKGKPMRVMWANHNAQIRKQGIGNIFIKGLSLDIDARTLHDTFEVFGSIISAKVAQDEDGGSLGYGYVQYESPQSAQEAVNRANGMLLEGQQITVAHYTSKDSRSGVKSFTNIYTKNLPPSIDSEEALSLFFSKFGEITSCFLPKDDTGVKGFGFVNFKDPESAQKAVHEMHNLDLDGCTLYVAQAQRKSERTKFLQDQFSKQRPKHHEMIDARNLYIKHLAPTIDDQQLEELFQSFGPITSAKVMRDENQKSKSFGFVSFSKIDDATRALSGMNNKEIEGRPLYVAIAQPRSTRQLQLVQNQLHQVGLGGRFYSSQIPLLIWNAGGGASQGLRAQVRGPTSGYQPTLTSSGPIEGVHSSLGSHVDSNGASMCPEQEKAMFGEQLYPLVHALNNEKAAKITGMLLEMDNEDIRHLIETPAALQDIVEDALDVLREYEGRS